MDNLFYVEKSDIRMEYCEKYLLKNGYLTTNDISIADNVILSFKYDKKISFNNRQNIFCYNNYNISSEYNSKSYCTPEYIKENSKLTAQGTLKVLLDNLKEDISELYILVLGYGNCGKAICNLFKPLCKSVYCYARRKESRKELAKNNIISLLSLKDINRFNVIINTIPNNVLNKEQLNELTPKNIYIEIASPPYGFDNTLLKNYNFKFILASGLPGKYTPISAGENIAKAVIGIIKEDGYE